MTDLLTESAHLSPRFHRGKTCFVFAPVIFVISVMAKYYKEIFQLLALGEESFEDVLQRDFSTVGIRRGVF